MKLETLHTAVKQDKQGKGSLLKKKQTDDDVISIDSVESVEPVEEKPIIVKEKKTRSQKQIDAFKKTQENRKANIEIKKEEKKIEAAKILLKEPKTKSKPKVIVSSSDDSSDEEVIIVEKRKKIKPKRIIVEESTDEETEEEKPKIKEKQFKSQQNKKSIIQVNNVKEPITNKNNMFFV
jgi:hypothetical protein